MLYPSKFAAAAAAMCLLMLASCASVAPTPSSAVELSPQARLDRDAARLKRIWSKRSINQVKGTQALTALPTIAVDETRGDWRRVGPTNYTGKVYKVAISHQDPKVVYAAYGFGGIWNTRDAGATWRAITPRSNHPDTYFTVAVDPTNDRRIVAGVGDIQKTGRDAGFFAIRTSEDGGATWKNISPADLGQFATVRILIDPANPKTILALTTKRLYRSDDAGKTWRSLFELTFTTGGDGWGGVPDVAVHPTNFNIMLLTHPNHGLQRSADGGVSWQALGSQVTDIGTTVLAWSKSNPSVVFLQTYLNPSGQAKYNMRVWRSTDAGLTWQFRKDMADFHQGRYDMSLVVDPTDPNRLIAGNASYVFTSDAFANYKATYCCGRVDIVDVQFAPTDPTVVYTAADQGLFRATDRGESIAAAQRFDTGVQTLRVFSFDVVGDTANPTGLVNAQDHPNFRGTFSAPTAWADIGGYEYQALHASPLDPNLVFNLGDRQQLRRSTNAGVTWEFVDPIDPTLGDSSPRPYYGLVAFHPTDANVVFAADRGVWRSSAKGAAESWAFIGPPASQVTEKIRSLKVARSNPSVLYALEFSWGIPVRIYVTQNAGTTWTTANTTAFYGLDLDVHPTNPARVLIGGAFELSLCDNYGATCKDIRMSPAQLDTAYRWSRFSPDGAQVWTGTDFGVFMTADEGITWRRVGNNLPLLEVLDLKYRNNRWITSNHQGAWELRTDSYGQPGAPTAAAATIAGGIRVSWDAVTGAQDYQVYRDGLLIFQGTATDLLMLDASVAVGTQYCYRVSASNSEGPGARSASQCATFSAVAGDTTPNAFSFAAATQAYPGRETTSGTATIAGIDTQSAISVTGGAYSLGCSGTFTASPGLISNGQGVCLRHTSSAAPGASATTTLTIGGVNGSFTSTSALSTVRAQVVSYYRTILGREADAPGLDYWAAEAARVQALGVNVNETWYAMAGAFFTSPEYLAVTRSNNAFVTNLYSTFLGRAPDAGGLAYWAGQLTSGLPREVALVSFMFSPEFAALTQSIFGASETRKELDTVVDFYRGLLARLPDDAGFNYWVGQFRTAQCQGPAAVTTQADTISRLYLQSGEYSARNRTDTQYVGDLYNAFLRRGGDLAGVQYWIDQIATGARTRENVRLQFVASPEFGARVSAVIAQGCLR